MRQALLKLREIQRLVRVSVNCRSTDNSVKVFEAVECQEAIDALEIACQTIERVVAEAGENR